MARPDIFGINDSSKTAHVENILGLYSAQWLADIVKNLLVSDSFSSQYLIINGNFALQCHVIVTSFPFPH